MGYRYRTKERNFVLFILVISGIAWFRQHPNTITFLRILLAYMIFNAYYYIIEHDWSHDRQSVI